MGVMSDDVKNSEEIEAMRERVLKAQEKAEGGSTDWHKLEAFEVALDWANNDNKILENVMSQYYE